MDVDLQPWLASYSMCKTNERGWQNGMFIYVVLGCLLGLDASGIIMA